jgi:hypothetical protein
MVDDVVLDEVVVDPTVLDDVVGSSDELVLDDWTGTGVFESDEPLSTLAAAAVTPPRIRAAATPAAASFRV